MASSINASTAGAGGVITTADNSGILQVQTAGTTALTISAAQAATFASTVAVASTIGVGGATPATSGAGITFPATQSSSSDANTLDDYEEGTWTPTIGGNATYTSRSGKYTKIGNTVHVWYQITINVKGTGDTYGISGLPFTTVATLTQYGLVGNFSNITTSVYSIYSYSDPSNTAVSFGAKTSSSTGTVVPITMNTDGTSYSGQFTYFAA